MSGLVSFLLFGGFFFLMMRFGCGAHAGHGGDGEHGDHNAGHGVDGNAPLTPSVDPVCGMRAAGDTGYAKMHHERTNHADENSQNWHCDRRGRLGNEPIPSHHLHAVCRIRSACALARDVSDVAQTPARLRVAHVA